MTPVSQSSLITITSVSLTGEEDIVTSRHRARQLSSQLGFANHDGVRIATAVSELARNALHYGHGGRVEFSVALDSVPQHLWVKVSDRGPGTSGAPSVATTGRLMDVFEVDSRPGEGTTIRIGKALPKERLTRSDLHHIVSELARQRTPGAFDEVRRQNQELLETLNALRSREDDVAEQRLRLEQLDAEIEETNRGVVALYGELDEKAEALREAAELRSRFLYHVSHEFRTPLNSILALARLLLDRADGELTPEQERQVGYIRRSAQDLTEMVNDLLDLSRVESGKTEIHLAPVSIAQLFGTLRGIMRPLATSEAVALVFDDPAPGLEIISDETKLSQILRNLISNALKFTEHGEIRVSCRVERFTRQVSFQVVDTGIGIAPDDQERIFQEFAQVMSPLQRKVKGTGLGLPLSRKLAHLLGGQLTVFSVPDKGSTFTLTLPLRIASEGGQHRDSILIIDDEESDRYIARQLFRDTRYRVIEASSGAEGAERARFERPALILLDLAMTGRSGFAVLDDLKSDPATAAIPVVINTSRSLESADFERLAGRHAAVLPKGDAGRKEALEYMARVLGEPSLLNGEESA
jgi:signal transduction histidine kinase/CheY-like chemotaxis protein